MFLRRSASPTALLAALALVACATPSADRSSDTSGSPSGSPGSWAQPLAVDPAITIDAPADGAVVTVPFAVSGTANTFEATLTIDAVDASGLTMCVRLLTATSGSGTPGTWDGVLAFPPEEDPLEVTLRAYSHSPADGSMSDLVERAITVAPDRPDIILTSPRCGDVYPVGTPIQILGTAALFEASLIVELRNSAGTAVVTLPVTAEQCCVEAGFSSTLTVPADLAPGFYDVVAYSLSPADGSQENIFPVQIQVVSPFEITG